MMSDRTSQDHEIIVIPPPGHQERRALLDQCINLRIDVFVHEQQFPLDVEIDEYVVLLRAPSPFFAVDSNVQYTFPGHRRDPTATHFLLRLIPSLTPIGTIRAYRVDVENYYKLSRLAVLKPYRQYRFGRDLVLALHRWVKDDARRNGATHPVRIVCHSQLPVKGFYSKCGYQPEGDEFDEDGAPHQKMVAHLSP